MSDKPEQNNQSPMVNLNLPGVLGAEEIQQVTVDHNRPHPAAEQANGWAAMLRLPSDGYEIVSKPAIAMLTGALSSSLALQLVAAPELFIPIGAVLLAISIVIWASAIRYKSLRVNMLVYFLLFLLGGVLGVGHAFWGLL